VRPADGVPADAVAAAWQASGGNLRVPGFLSADLAGTLRDALRHQQMSLERSPIGLFQYFHYPFWPDDDCEHPLCAFARWLRTDGAAWVSAITGRDLVSPPDEIFVGFWYGKGCWLDAHNDFGKGRAVAFVIGLTAEPWPESDGGWLEFLDADHRVIERRPPGFGTVDLFDVSHRRAIHRVPMVRTHRERLTISGWFYPRVPGEGIDP
jgi:hypothetical protein